MWGQCRRSEVQLLIGGLALMNPPTASAGQGRTVPKESRGSVHPLGGEGTTDLMKFGRVSLIKTN